MAYRDSVTGPTIAGCGIQGSKDLIGLEAVREEEHMNDSLMSWSADIFVAREDKHQAIHKPRNSRGKLQNNGS